MPKGKAKIKAYEAERQFINLIIDESGNLTITYKEESRSNFQTAVVDMPAFYSSLTATQKTSFKVILDKLMESGLEIPSGELDVSLIDKWKQTE